MSKIWVKRDDVPEGKYLVVRRDGSIPDWGHFVLSYTDPATPVALQAYAQACEMLDMDAEYVASIRELAEELSQQPRDPKSDPDSGPHRKDNPAVVRLMRREADLRSLKLADIGLRK
jgi:hypothetical protein